MKISKSFSITVFTVNIQSSQSRLHSIYKNITGNLLNNTYYCQEKLRHLRKFVWLFECWQTASNNCAKVIIISP